MSETATIKWLDTPRGSLCENEGDLYLRWPTPAPDGSDAMWLRTKTTTAAIHDGRWKLVESWRTSRVIVDKLSDEQCNVLSKLSKSPSLPSLRPREDIIALAQAFRRARSLLVTKWSEVKGNSIALIVRSDSSQGYKSCLGEIVWFRRTDGASSSTGEFLGHVISELRRVDGWTVGADNAFKGDVCVLHSDAASLPGLRELFDRSDIAGVLKLCGVTVEATTTADDSAADELLTPGSLVRLASGADVLRWPEPDENSGNDFSFVYPGDSMDEPAGNARVFRNNPDRPVEVIGKGLSRRVCNAIASTSDQPQRWALATGYYTTASRMFPGSVWTTPNGWGVTWADGSVTWKTNGERWAYSRASLQEYEKRLERGVLDEEDDHATDAFAHLELATLSDALLSRVLDSDHPLRVLADSLRDVSTSWYSSGQYKGWVALQVATHATFHISPPHREALYSALARKLEQFMLNGLEYGSTGQSSTLLEYLGFFGIHITRSLPGAPCDIEYLGWWGQDNAPTRATGPTDLLLEYMRHPPDADQTASAVLGAHPSAIVRMSGDNLTARSGPASWSMLDLAGRLTARLATGKDRRVVRAGIPIVANGLGRAELVRVRVVSGRNLPVGCGLQPMHIDPNVPGECDLLMLWPYGDGERGRAQLANAATSALREKRCSGAFLGHKNLRVQFA